MDDMMAKIQEVLNDEESMNQIKQLASMLGASGDGNGSGNQQNSQEMPDFSKMFAGLSSGSNQNNQSNGDAPPIDFGTLMQIQGLIQSATSNDKNADLLIALKPHLKEDKQQKIDKAVKLLKLFAIYTAAKQSGMLNSFDLFK